MPSRGWTDADDLQLGDLLVGDDGTAIEVTQLDSSTRIAVVHNLTVNRIHTYYVLAGEESVLVHNSCHGNSLASTKPTDLYRLTDKKTGYEKTGISSNSSRRYSKTYMRGKDMKILATGSRREMAKLERRIVEWGPGPKNLERWRGNKWG